MTEANITAMLLGYFLGASTAVFYVWYMVVKRPELSVPKKEKIPPTPLQKVWYIKQGNCITSNNKHPDSEARKPALSHGQWMTTAEDIYIKGDMLVVVNQINKDGQPRSYMAPIKDVEIIVF